MIDPYAPIRAALTNDVIRAIGALARQRNVCREQGGQAVFVTGLEAAREYVVEQIMSALNADRDALAKRVQALEQAVKTARDVVEHTGVHPSSCPKGVGISLYKPPADAVCRCGIDAVLSAALVPPTPGGE